LAVDEGGRETKSEWWRVSGWGRKPRRREWEKDKKKWRDEMRNDNAARATAMSIVTEAV
jgi:hypothetical protein